MQALGRIFAALDGVIGGARSAVGRAGDAAVQGPLQGVLFGLIIGGTGLSIVLGRLARLADRLVGTAERAVALVALLAMALLAFNEYLQRELRPRFGTDLGGLWALEGQMNLALLLMVVTGFLGASLATQEGKHIALDASDKVLAPGAARFVKRITAALSAGVAWMLFKATVDGIYKHSADAFPGLKVWSWMAAPINAATSLLPAEKYGPGTPFADRFAWEDAKYAADAALTYDTMPAAFPYVAAGDKFPLWVPLAVIAFAFLIMSLRFAAQILTPRFPDGEPRERVGNRSVADVVMAGAFPGALLILGFGLYFGQGATILLASILIIVLGAPLWVGIGVGTVACWVLVRDNSVGVVIDDMFEATNKQELLSIPFFVLAGNLMTTGSIATRLIAVARAVTKGIPGGVGAAAVLACAFFAAISGSSPVTVIAIGAIMFPMLLKEGYSERYSLGVLSTAGSLGIIIPPSIPMVVYAVMVSGLEVTDPVTQVTSKLAVDPTVLFKAGILPGLFIAGVLMAYTFYIHWPRAADAGMGTGALAPAVAMQAPGAAIDPTLTQAVLRGLPSLMLPVVILGGIYGLFSLRPFGIDFAVAFSVTEAAAVAVIYALFVELVLHREMKVSKLWGVCSDSALQMGSLFLILVMAISLNKFLTFQQIPEAATDFVLSYVDSKITFLIVVNLFLLGVGALMDVMSAIFIVAPLLAPIAATYGIHPVHFGIMFIVNLEIGYLTPPMGINLFVASTVFERPLSQVMRAVIPFLLLMLFSLAVVVWVPWLSLALIDDAPAPQAQPALEE